MAAMKIYFMKSHAQYVVWDHHATKIFIFVVQKFYNMKTYKFT